MNIIVSLLYLVAYPLNMRLALSAMTLFLSFGIRAQVPDSIRGDWSCVNIHCKMMCEECCIYPRYDVRITDSLYYFDYPTQYISSSVFHPEYWKMSNDTLFYAPDSGVQFIYKRQETAFNESIIRALKRETINVLSLTNRKWKLQTWKEDDIGEEGFDHTVRYPFKLPSKLFYTLDDLKTNLKGTQIQILIDGKKHWCTIVELSSARLTLRTGKWRKEPVEFTYLLIN